MNDELDWAEIYRNIEDQFDDNVDHYSKWMVAEDAKPDRQLTHEEFEESVYKMWRKLSGINE